MNRRTPHDRSENRIKVAQLPTRSWWPELAFAALLVIAALETANLLA